MNNPFRYFNSSPEVIRLAVMMYIRYPMSLRQVEDILLERGIDICHETVRFWWNRAPIGADGGNNLMLTPNKRYMSWTPGAQLYLTIHSCPACADAEHNGTT